MLWVSPHVKHVDKPELFVRYERQLWDANWADKQGNSSYTDGGLITFHGGTLGIFVLDVGDRIDDVGALYFGVQARIQFSLFDVGAM